MTLESFFLLAGLIAAHHNRQVRGRSRLQRVVWLLQRIGFPTDYQFSLFFGGPYSGGIAYDLRFLERRNLLTETEVRDQSEEPFFLIEAPDQPIPPEIDPYHWAITLLEQTDPVVLELATSYDVSRELGYDHEGLSEDYGERRISGLLKARKPPWNC